MKVAVREAKNNLSKLGDLAHAGRTITVCKHGKPWFDLVPHRTGPREVGPLAKGKPQNPAREATAPVDSRDLPGWI